MALWADGDDITAARLNNQEVETLTVQQHITSTGPGARLELRGGGARIACADIGLDVGTTASVSGAVGADYGILTIMSGEVFGRFMLRGNESTSIKLEDYFGNLSTTDAAGKMCVFPAGSGNYSIKNNLSSAQWTMLQYFGFPSTV